MSDSVIICAIICITLIVISAISAMTANGRRGAILKAWYVAPICATTRGLHWKNLQLSDAMEASFVPIASIRALGYRDSCKTCEFALPHHR